MCTLRKNVSHAIDWTTGKCSRDVEKERKREWKAQREKEKEEKKEKEQKSGRKRIGIAESRTRATLAALIAGKYDGASAREVRENKSPQTAMLN